MFFDKNNLSAQILDVIELNQKNINTMNSNRNFNALSFRYYADTVLQTEEKDYKLMDNSVCFVPSYVTYRRISYKESLIVVHFNISNCTFKKIEVFTPENAITYQNLFKQILNCWHSKETGYEYICNSLLYQILSLCYKENFVANQKSNPIQNSVNYIETHFRDPNITISQVANQSFMSEVYFRKLFKKEFGISPIKYIINLKIEYAVSLIQTGYYSLYEIASLSGYDDYSYFSSEFKRIKGVSPSDFEYHFNLQT